MFEHCLLMMDGRMWMICEGCGPSEWQNEKFPDGLNFLQSLKDHHSIKFVGLWHTINGYWNGLSPTLPTDFETVMIGGNLLPSSTSASLFFKAYHSEFLTTVDFWKVDNQAFLDEEMAGGLQRAYQKGLRETVGEGDRIVWCMAHCPSIIEEIGFALGKDVLDTVNVGVIRSSDDFFPDVASSHPWHIYTNAITTLLFSNLNPTLIPDWDMFQTNHTYARPHLISRLLSGGPVFLSDPINHIT
ncbi:glycoside hydrolase superfamily [Chytridium lagenaria]|nr:glycoside hydrolase superfamily [Chytridium lagenaria]